MTPQEKAERLVNVYCYKVNSIDPKFTINFIKAKNLAIVLVDEILNTIYNEDFEGHLVDEIGASDYWKQVKLEIEKL